MLLVNTVSHQFRKLCCSRHWPLLRAEPSAARCDKDRGGGLCLWWPPVSFGGSMLMWRSTNISGVGGLYTVLCQTHWCCHYVVGCRVNRLKLKVKCVSLKSLWQQCQKKMLSKIRTMLDNPAHSCRNTSSQRPVMLPRAKGIIPVLPVAISFSHLFPLWINLSNC